MYTVKHLRIRLFSLDFLALPIDLPKGRSVLTCRHGFLTSYFVVMAFKGTKVFELLSRETEAIFSLERKGSALSQYIKSVH
jgi:hypothetical protein